MPKITLDELRTLLEATGKRGARAVTLTAVTLPPLKKGNPFSRALKVQRVNGFINTNYETAVNRQRTRENQEAEFEAEPRVWGERISGTPLVYHKGKFYLEVKAERLVAVKYVEGKRIIPESEIQPHLKERKSPPKQHLSKEVSVRDFALTNIHKIKIDGVLYTIKKGN